MFGEPKADLVYRQVDDGLPRNTAEQEGWESHLGRELEIGLSWPGSKVAGHSTGYWLFCWREQIDMSPHHRNHRQVLQTDDEQSLMLMGMAGLNQRGCLEGPQTLSTVVLKKHLAR